MKSTKWYLSMFLIILLGMSAGYWGFLRSSAADFQLIKHDFERIAEARALALEKEIKLNLEILSGLKNLFDASDFVNRDEFRIFTKSFLREHKTIKALVMDPSNSGC